MEGWREIERERERERRGSLHSTQRKENRPTDWSGRRKPAIPSRVAQKNTIRSTEARRLLDRFGTHFQIEIEKLGGENRKRRKKKE